jgi:Septum formation
LWCSIQEKNIAIPEPTPVSLQLFTGNAKGANQTFLYPVGTCIATGTPPVVPCSASHQYEVTGTITIDPASLPQTQTEWRSAVGSSCMSLALSYHGGPLPSGVAGGWLFIPQSSWDIGDRSVQWTIGWFDSNGNPTGGSGSLKG